MRIVVHGQQAFGKAVLEALLKRGEDVVAVYAAPQKPGQKPDPLMEAALAAGLPVHQPRATRNPRCGSNSPLKPDLQVMAFVTLFVPEDFLISRPTARSSITPRCCPPIAARSAINWPIIKGESETGCRSSGPTTGSIPANVLMQKKTADLRALRSDRCFVASSDADIVRSGEAGRRRASSRMSRKHLMRALRAGNAGISKFSSASARRRYRARCRARKIDSPVSLSPLHDRPIDRARAR